MVAILSELQVGSEASVVEIEASPHQELTVSRVSRCRDAFICTVLVLGTLSITAMTAYLGVGEEQQEYKISLFAISLFAGLASVHIMNQARRRYFVL